MIKVPRDFRVDMVAKQTVDGAEDWSMKISVTLKTSEEGEALRQAMDLLLPLLPKGQERTLSTAAESGPASKPSDPPIESATDGSNACGKNTIVQTEELYKFCDVCQNTGWCFGHRKCIIRGVALPSQDRP